MATRFDSDSDIVNKTIAEARLNAEKHAFLFFAVSAEFDDDTLRVNTTAGDVIFGGNTYQGVGTLLSMSELGDTAELKSAGLTITYQDLIRQYCLTHYPMTIITAL